MDAQPDSTTMDTVTTDDTGSAQAQGIVEPTEVEDCRAGANNLEPKPDTEATEAENEPREQHAEHGDYNASTLIAETAEVASTEEATSTSAVLPVTAVAPEAFETSEAHEASAAAPEPNESPEAPEAHEADEDLQTGSAPHDGLKGQGPMESPVEGHATESHRHAAAHATNMGSRPISPGIGSRPVSPGVLLYSGRPVYRPDTAYSTPPAAILRTHGGVGEGQLLYQIGVNKVGSLVVSDFVQIYLKSSHFHKHSITPLRPPPQGSLARLVQPMPRTGSKTRLPAQRWLITASRLLRGVTRVTGKTLGAI